MNYKSLIKSRNLRLKILGYLDLVPDSLMIKLQFLIKKNKWLNFNKVKTFNEKIQWYKLNYRNPLMTICADKYKVREYVKKKNLETILVPIYGVYEDSYEINFDNLPNKFVLKANNGSHTNILCTNKEELDLETTKRTLDSWLKERTTKAGREWAYYNIKPKIICEKLLEVENDNLIDYKFYCFNGKAYYLKVATNTTSSNNGPENGIFNMDFEQLPYCRKEVPKITKEMEKPLNFKEMCNIAEKLSEDFPHVRVDLYNIEGVIYFGELTFYDTSGYQIFEPVEFDDILGDLFILEEYKV